MKPRARITAKTIILAALGLGTVASVAGAYVVLQPRIGGDGSALLAVPNAGGVRLVTQPIKNGTDELHYKWSLIGSSNWRKATGDGTEFALSDTYPLNSATERGGCHIYEADLFASKATGKWTITLHGSDDTTIRSEGVLPAGKSVGQTIRITHSADSTRIGTPNRIVLAQIDGKPFRLSVAR